MGLMKRVLGLGVLCAAQLTLPAGQVPAAACGGIHYGGGGGEVQGYAISGSGGQAKVTITLTGAPQVPQGSSEAMYAAVWDSGSQTYFAGLKVSPVPWPSAAPVSQYTPIAGMVMGGGFKTDSGTAVTSSVDGSVITLTFPYGNEADTSMGVSNSAAYVRDFLGVEPGKVGQGVLPVTLDASVVLMDATTGTPTESKPGAETGPGGRPFC
jgi:hypothetical protein